MGKIFGISDSPVSLPTSPFESVIDFRNPYENEIDKAIRNQNRIQNQGDVFVSKRSVAKSNPIISMRNGFGKLMKHFSKKI